MAVKKKRWFDVEVPILGDRVSLLGYEIQDLEGRTMLLDLTRILRGKSIEVKCKVHVENGKAFAEPNQLTLLPYFWRRGIRKGTNTIEDSFSADVKNAKIRIKFILVTRKKVSKAVQTALRNKAREELLKWAENKEIDELFDDIVKNRIQRPLSLVLKKIYPLSMCEIRMLVVEERKEEKLNAKARKKSEKASAEKPPADVIAEELKEKAEAEEARHWGEPAEEERERLEEAAGIEKKKK
jgi:ribosomal protein S3AE